MKQILVQVLGNTNPQYFGFLDEVNEYLEKVGIELVDFPTVEKPIYLRIPWNQLLKLMVREYPEFKSDDAKRKALKQTLWRQEQELDQYVDDNEELLDILTLGENEYELPLQAAQVVAYKYKGVLI